MLCNNGKCKKVRSGEDIHPIHDDSKKEIMKSRLSRELTLVIITAIGVTAESFYVYLFMESTFPELKQIGNFESLFVEIGIAIFIAVTVYVYSTKSERERKIRLRRQIISSFEMLCTDFAWLVTQRVSPSINEEFITKKNLRLFHIQNLIGMLPEKLGMELSRKIPDFCEKALLIPIIVRPLNPTQAISVDYTGCEDTIIASRDILRDLCNKWKIK